MKPLSARTPETLLADIAQQISAQGGSALFEAGDNQIVNLTVTRDAQGAPDVTFEMFEDFDLKTVSNGELMFDFRLPVIYQRIDPAPPADPRVSEALGHLDAVALYSLRGLGEADYALYRALRVQGPEAPIHRFLHDNPIFAGWLEERNSEGRHVPSSLATADDPEIWICDALTARIRHRWPDASPPVKTIKALIAAIIALKPEGYCSDVRPEALTYLAHLPAAAIPKTRVDLENALKLACEAAQDSTANPSQFHPRATAAMFTGDWVGDRERLRALLHAHSQTHDTKILLHAHHLLYEILDQGFARRDWQMNNLVAWILGNRIQRVCEPGRTIQDLFEGLRGASREHPFLDSLYVLEHLRGLSAKAFVTALGFDVAAINALYTDSKDRTERSLQAEILRPGLRSRRFGSEPAPLTWTFYQETIDGTTWLARIGDLEPDNFRCSTAGLYICDRDGRGDVRYGYHRRLAFGSEKPRDDRTVARFDQLHDAFGFAIAPNSDQPRREHDFYASRAAQGLRRWVRRNTRTAAIFTEAHPESLQHPVIGDWYAWAISRSPTHNTPLALA